MASVQALRGAAVATAVTALALAALLTAWLLQHGAYARFEPVPRLADVAASPPLEAPARLHPSLVGRDPERLLQAVMDAVPRSAPSGNRDHLAAIEAGHWEPGMICSGMAAFYHAVLWANGIPARIVSLARNPFAPVDTHVTVEVRRGDRWVIMDPTFHVVFERGKVALGAREVQQALYAGEIGEVRARFLGPTRYPARLERYYVSWMPLFDNVLLNGTSRRGIAYNAPPMRYFVGPYYVYEAGAGDTRHFAFQDALYVLAVLVLPTTALLAALAALATFRRGRAQ